MLRIKEIQDSLLHLVGWQQGGTSEAKIGEYLTKSESGLYFQQTHPLLTLTNIASIAPDYKNMNPPVEATAVYRRNGFYPKGSIIAYGSTFYIALQDTVASNIENSTENWSEVDPFSLWLENKTKASIAKAITRFCTEKYAEGTSKTLCESKTLFDGTGRLSDTVTNRNNLVGFEIVPIRSRGVTTQINRIGLQFTVPGIYKLYLMHSSSDVPVKIIELEKKVKGFEWFTVKDLFLPYQSENTDAGGSWYLCYKQTELPEGSQAIKKDRDWSKGPCNSCSRKEYIAWQAWSKYIEVHPFSIKEEQAEDLDGSTVLWDIKNNVYTYDNNYGINLDISVYCDLTDFIIDKRNLFVDAIMCQVAIDMLREFAYNPNVRTNRHSINASRMDILYEIDGDSSFAKKSGLSYRLEQAFRAINLTTQGIDRVCMTCKSNGIKYRTV